MATATNILEMLRPEGGWVIYDNDFDQIQWIDCKPLTRKEFDAGFEKYDAWLAEKEQEKINKKIEAEAKLEALGLTIDDIKTLLS